MPEGTEREFEVGIEFVKQLKISGSLSKRDDYISIEKMKHWI